MLNNHPERCDYAAHIRPLPSTSCSCSISISISISISTVHTVHPHYLLQSEKEGPTPSRSIPRLLQNERSLGARAFYSAIVPDPRMESCGAFSLESVEAIHKPSSAPVPHQGRLHASRDPKHHPTRRCTIQEATRFPTQSKVFNRPSQNSLVSPFAKARRQLLQHERRRFC